MKPPFFFAKCCGKFVSVADENFPQFLQKFATFVKAFCCRLQTGFNNTPGCKPGAASLHFRSLIRQALTLVQ
jgi:hypothetical protein